MPMLAVRHEVGPLKLVRSPLRQLLSRVTLGATRAVDQAKAELAGRG